MKQRIITGLILIVLASLWLTTPYPQFFLAGLLLIVFIGAFEYSQFIFRGEINDEHLLKSPSEYIKKNGWKPVLQRLLYSSVVIFSGTLLVTAATEKSNLDYILLDDTRLHQLFAEGSNILVMWVFILSAAWWILSAFLVLRYPKNSGIVSSKFFKILAGFIYFIPFFMAAGILRFQSFVTDSSIGAVSILSVMVLVWAADSGAYFVGKACGKHKMSPHVSPNKTFEGLAGGVVLALIIFAVLVYFGCYGKAFQMNMFALTVASVVTVVFSVIGDLWESLLKRESGIKDSGFIFPGHGGMLDRIDSLLAALPVFLITFAALDRILG
ncbi:phosphatidate cytidylyltransferase [Ruminobacter amylophilus]|uniref:phosphatidate cytidylyltransferase n=1 Tax=Ruminobacter amylophilus TaxID=867 RepID=UPI00386CD793